MKYSYVIKLLTRQGNNFWHTEKELAEIKNAIIELDKIQQRED